jgi:hypothetical protein
VVCPSQISKVDEIIALAWPRDGHRKILAMIEAYLDESGIHDKARICVIGGYFGGPSQIKRLESAWKRTLADFNFPMKDFHAKDLLKNPKRRPMLKMLAKVAGEQQKVYPAICGIVVDDFNSFSLQERRFLTGAILDPKRRKLVTSGCPSKSYFVPFQNMVKLVTDAAPRGGKAHFSFGIDREFAEYATAMFKQMVMYASVNHPIHEWKSRDRLGDSHFPQASETAPLQAADLLVYLAYQHLDEHLRTGEKLLKPSELFLLCTANSRCKEDHSFQRKEHLQYTIDQAKRIAPGWKNG